MPEAALAGSLVGVEFLSDLISCMLILRFFRFFMEEEQEIPGEHAVEVCKRDIGLLAVFIGIKNVAFVINMRIDPVFNVLKIPLIARSPPDQVLTVEI